MEDIQVEERLRADEPRFAIGDFVSNVLMAAVLGFVAWRLYGAVKPLVVDDSIPLPLVFSETPTIEDHLPDGFVSPDGFELAQSRFAGETPAGFQYWVLGSTEEANEICLFVVLGEDESQRATGCDTLEGFAAQGVSVSFEGAPGEGGESFVGAGRYLAEEMELVGSPPEAKSFDRFFFVEGPEATYGGVVDTFRKATVTGGSELENSDDS